MAEEEVVGTDTGPESADAKLKKETAEMFESIRQYLAGELLGLLFQLPGCGLHCPAGTKDFTLLERMNEAVSSKYSNMSESLHILYLFPLQAIWRRIWLSTWNPFKKNVRRKDLLFSLFIDKEFQPYLDQVDELESQISCRIGLDNHTHQLQLWNRLSVCWMLTLCG